MKNQTKIILLSFLLLAACNSDENGDVGVAQPTPYITKILDFRPAPGQYTNALPEYEQGDTQEDINEKVLERIGNNNLSTISLGGYGGYVVVGFDHTIENVEGLCDFRVLGNAYYSEASADSPSGGSCEAGIILVSRDENGNGLADDQWFEIVGSSHGSASQEPWYEMALEAGCDTQFYDDYQVTYFKPSTEDVGSEYILWSDNKGGSGYIPKNQYHTQSYFPAWIDSESLTFEGSRLPQNGIADGSAMSYVLYKFNYGYVDNATNDSDESAIDIGWAYDQNGSPAALEGIDFIKIYTATNQVNGWLGECSTEITGVEDLHLLGVEIATW